MINRYSRIAIVAFGTVMGFMLAANRTHAASFELTQTFLNPSPDFQDNFGFSVALADNRVLVGAPFDDTGAITSGTAYLFNASTGNLLQTFLNPTPGEVRQFGNSVALADNLVVIGAPGTQENKVYLFDANTGNLLQTFLSPALDPFNAFGFSVALVDNQVLIGDFGAGTEPNTDTGAAYLFDATTGTLLQTFLSPTPGRFGAFGLSVALADNLALIGAPQENTFNGAAYLFNTITGTLLQTFSNPTPDNFDNFGDSVALVGNKVLIGAPFDHIGAQRNGAAYLFDATTGTLLQTFLNPTPADYDRFGDSVALVGNNVLIGAPEDDDIGIENSGAAYLFDATTGTLLQSFFNPTPGRFDEFGFSVALADNQLLIGSRFDNDGGINSGAAYLFRACHQ
jgi:outer membrane protein assembly factor BamB